jgi:hypothetical protein
LKKYKFKIKFIFFRIIKMMTRILIIIIHFIINTLKFNSLNIGIMRTSIINPSGKFYDFINEHEYIIDNNKFTGYSKVNLTRSSKMTD